MEVLDRVLYGIMGVMILGVMVELLRTPVAPTDLVSVVVDPLEATLVVGSTLQYTATGILGDGSSADVTAVWSTTDPSVATIDTTGLATTVGVGVCQVVAEVSGIYGYGTLTVAGTPVPTSIFEHYNTLDDPTVNYTYSWRLIRGNVRVAQTFTPQVSHYLTHLWLDVALMTQYPDSVYLHVIRCGAEHAPIDALLTMKYTVTGLTLPPEGRGWTRFILATPIPVEAGIEYGVVLQFYQETIGTTRYMNVHNAYRLDPVPYSRGVWMRSLDGISWEIAPGQVILFEEWGYT